jgi:flagellar hook assembly protein FlgD
MPILTQGTKLLPLKDGLIPNDCVVKMRVANSYLVEKGVGTNNNYPTYQFSIKNREAQALAGATIDGALDEINVVPNPYYGYSAYESTQFSNVVKITNLPAKCVVTIYSLDGQFIKQYKRDEVGASNAGRSNPPVGTKQITPAIEWDLKNNKGIPVSSGVYLIHVTAEGMGERIIKWFGVARQYDPSGL